MKESTMAQIHRTLLAAGAIAAVTTTAFADAAGAQPPPRVELTGTGTYQSDPWGLTAVRSPVTWRPFDGMFTGGLRIDAFPGPGSCVEATLLFGVTRTDSRHELGLISIGEVCGQQPDSTSVVTAVFTGEYDLYEGTRKDLIDTQGFVEVRLTNDGRAAVTLVDHSRG
jgi:hypothetical protein